MGFNLNMEGKLKATRNRLFSVRTPLGRLWMTRDKGEGVFAGQPFFTNLKAEHLRGGIPLAAYDMGSGLITTAGVTLMAADWTNTSATLKVMNNHDSGTGTTAAATSNTTLGTATGIARVAGTQSNSGVTYTTEGTITYDGTYSITEWGLFSASTSGTLWDRRVFTAIPVIADDQITFKYTLTLVAGG